MSSEFEAFRDRFKNLRDVFGVKSKADMCIVVLKSRVLRVLFAIFGVFYREDAD